MEYIASYQPRSFLLRAIKLLVLEKLVQIMTVLQFFYSLNDIVRSRTKSGLVWYLYEIYSIKVVTHTRQFLRRRLINRKSIYIYLRVRVIYFANSDTLLIELKRSLFELNFAKRYIVCDEPLGKKGWNPLV